jgi:hypothetical protein
MYVSMLKDIIIDLAKGVNMHRRNRFVAVLVMPVAVILWAVGWVFYWFGSKSVKPIPEETPVQRQESELQFTVIMPEQQYAE